MGGAVPKYNRASITHAGTGTFTEKPRAQRQMVHSVKSHIHFTLFYGQRMQVGAEATAVEEAAVETQGEAFSEVKISRHSVSLSPRSLLKHSLPFQLPGDQCLQQCSAQL